MIKAAHRRTGNEKSIQINTPFSCQKAVHSYSYCEKVLAHFSSFTSQWRGRFLDADNFEGASHLEEIKLNKILG